MDLIVTPAVLIPRPETEHVIETVLELAGVERAGGRGHSPQTSRFRVADVGTGSGGIALALAKELPQAEIHASDISPAALEVARINAARHQMESRIQFREADLLAGFESNSFDFVVSNPPYVGESEEDQVQLEVRKFEPRSAVFGGPTGIEVIERLIPQAHRAIQPGGWLVMEISGTISEEVQRLVKAWREVRIRPDLQSIPRVVQAQKQLPGNDRGLNFFQVHNVRRRLAGVASRTIGDLIAFAAGFLQPFQRKVGQRVRPNVLANFID